VCACASCSAEGGAAGGGGGGGGGSGSLARTHTRIVRVVAPGVPPARLEILRRAFDATMKDPEFLAEARKMLLDSDPTTGEETQKIIAKLYQTPPEVVERAKKLLTPQ